MDKKIILDKVDNIQVLADLANSIWHEYWKGKLSDLQIDYMIEKFQSKNAILKQLESENYTYYFIKHNNLIIGYIGVASKEDYLFLSKFYIMKKYRSMGYGTIAFNLLVNLISNSSASIRLTVNKYNTPSINAYKKWGFQIVDSVVTDIGQGFVMDDYIMSYSLQCE